MITMVVGGVGAVLTGDSRFDFRFTVHYLPLQAVVSPRSVAVHI